MNKSAYDQKKQFPTKVQLHTTVLPTKRIPTELFDSEIN